MSFGQDSPLSRRNLLLGGVAATGAGVLAPLMPAEAARVASESGAISLLLHDRRLVPDATLTGKVLARDARVVVLSEDPVRQWRDESATWLARPEARVLGITRWPDFLVLRGLAAEARRHVRFASAISDAGVLTWLIG